MVASMYGKNVHFHFIHFQDKTTFGAQKIKKKHNKFVDCTVKKNMFTLSDWNSANILL